ncbi:DinB family protein [Sporosarcina oncorhynchi]|uniref:DinB family protein n=1 Tax=Sporosarcina oncorhynchi TaxID=3056444 RepID=A0ABZ0L2R5_9BACL|nr:DinB family protein [Sporosarcina sp. T2O-4]WOV86753.1 DinB family protein [Sporosarcina sp. T2O-4]
MQINEEARVKLLDAFDGLSDEELNRLPTDGGWSIAQIIEHLYLMEGGIAKTIQHQLATGPTQETPKKPIDRTIDRSVKVDAPEFAVPKADFASSQELKAKLAASHGLLRQLAETVPAEQLESKAYPHPVFGDMSLKQWIPFVGYHELRHIEQLLETKEAVSHR